MAKQRYVVACIKHGVDSSDWAGKQVVTSKPKTKAQRRNSGCPQCKKELLK